MDLLTIPHTYAFQIADGEGEPYTATEFDARVTIEVIEDGEDWSVEEIEIECARGVGQACERKWIAAPQWLFDAIRRDVSSRVDDEIAKALTAGDIGPHMRRASAAERRREMAVA
jgi:hypothetical protein